MIAAIRDGYNAALASHVPRLKSAFWKRVATKYKKIRYVLPQSMGDDSYVSLCLFAATHHVSVGIGRFAWADEARVKLYRRTISGNLVRVDFDSEALYVFQNEGLWDLGVLHMGGREWAGVVDSYFVIAPGWDDQGTAPNLRRGIPNYDLGTELRFGAGENGTKYLGLGWSNPETTWIWSDG
jgi:hypothetical protein